MALTPAATDPNREKELARKEKDPDSYNDPMKAKKKRQAMEAAAAKGGKR